MENQKVKELKDDVIIDIKVNKSFYLMSKAALLTILSEITDPSEKDMQTFIKNLVSKDYKDMNDKERSFYTVALLIAEIEKQAKETDNLADKEILLPGDEGFEMPKIASED